MSALLAADNLELAYGALSVCRGISIEINEGEIVALIGANGAGKSTTLRAIAGLMTPRAGAIIFRGQDITRLPSHERMLEFARALATRPKLLLIDEPAAGLNASEVDSLLDRILTTRQKGVSVVVVEHNMELVMNVADRVLVMDYGQHLFEGVPADVQKNAAVVSAYLGGELM